MENIGRIAIVAMLMWMPCVLGEVYELKQQQQWGFLTDPDSWTVLASGAPLSSPAPTSHGKHKHKAKAVATPSVSPAPSPSTSLPALSTAPSISPASPPAENGATAASSYFLINVVVGVCMMTAALFLV